MEAVWSRGGLCNLHAHLIRLEAAGSVAASHSTQRRFATSLLWSTAGADFGWLGRTAKTKKAIYAMKAMESDES